MSPTATAETLSAKDDYFFRTTATTDLYAQEVILELKHFEGLQGDFSFDSFGDVQKPQVSISTVRDGQFFFVE